MSLYIVETKTVTQSVVLDAPPAEMMSLFLLLVQNCDPVCCFGTPPPEQQQNKAVISSRGLNFKRRYEWNS